MKKILVIGSSGLVGKELCVLLEKNNCHVTKASRHSTPPLDLTTFDHADFSSYDTVILTANLAGGVNFCEKNPELSTAFHFMATKKIVDSVKKAGCRFVFISTDYVFPDHLQNVSEDQIPNPLNQYGKDKASAEKYISSHLTNFLIIRTTNVYGWDPGSKTPNYLMNFYQHLKNGQHFRAPHNIFCTPTNVQDLAQCIVKLDNAKQTGIFHVVGDEYLSRFQWLQAACEAWGFEKSLLESFTDISHSPKRPFELKLSNQKVKSTIQYEFKNLKSSLNEIKVKSKN